MYVTFTKEAMAFIPKSHQKSKQQKKHPAQSPDEVRATVAQIREMCDKVEQALGAGSAETSTFRTREAKPVPTSLSLCPDELRHIINENMLATPVLQQQQQQQEQQQEQEPVRIETPPARSIYDDVFS